VGLGAVLDYAKPSLPGHLHDGIHLARPSGQMDGDDRPGSRREDRSDRLGGEVLAYRINVGEHGDRAAHQAATCRGNEAPAGNDHLVTGSDSEGAKGQLQGHGPVGHGHRVPAPDPLGKLFFEESPLPASPIVDLP